MRDLILPKISWMTIAKLQTSLFGVAVSSLKSSGGDQLEDVNKSFQ